MKNILIEKMNHTGDGIAKKDGKVVFIPKALPGDIVEIKDIKEYKNYSQASIKEITFPSKDRIIPKCPYFEKCGGCQLMNMTYENQLKYKKEQVKNIFEKYGNIKIEPEIVPSNQYEYRNKITLQVKNGKIGLFTSNSNDIVEIEECLLVTKKINNLIKLIKNNLDVKEISQIIIKETTEDIMIIFKGKIDKQQIINTLKEHVKSIYINSECIYGKKFIQEKLGDYQFNISSSSFFQINKKQTINLYNQVFEYLDNKVGKVMDLYCGTGTIGIYISKKCNQVLGIEINKEAIENAKQNKILNNVTNIEFKCGDVGKIIKNNTKYDAIIVDPPRSGLDKRTKKILSEISSNQIIYVSCNPITLIRDINDLKEKYEIKGLKLFDMFPNTYHVECVMWLCHKK